MNNRVQETEAEVLRESQALERYLERLQHEQRPHRQRWMTPEQARVYQMATLFRAASPGATTPDPVFTARLQERVEAEVGNRPCRDKE